MVLLKQLMKLKEFLNRLMLNRKRFLHLKDIKMEYLPLERIFRKLIVLYIKSMKELQLMIVRIKIVVEVIVEVIARIEVGAEVEVKAEIKIKKIIPIYEYKINYFLIIYHYSITIFLF